MMLLSISEKHVFRADVLDQGQILAMSEEEDLRIFVSYSRPLAVGHRYDDMCVFQRIDIAQSLLLQGKATSMNILFTT